MWVRVPPWASNIKKMENKTDKSNFRQMILNFPKQFAKALEITKNVRIGGEFNKLLICGMGGSAQPADLLKTYLGSKNINLSIEVCRTYNLPPSCDEKTLIFASSYSGNTEETLSCFEEALDKKFNIIGFASGGKLEELCGEHDIPFVKYPDDGPDFQPRFALGYSVSSMALVLANQGFVPEVEQDIKSLANSLNPKKFENLGKEIADNSKEVVPIFYSSDRYSESVARPCKIKINENTKIPSFYNYFPELNHNEMNGFFNPIGKYHVIIFKDQDDHPRILRRMEVTTKLYEEKGLKATTINMEGKSVLEKIYNSLMLSDWISYYIALSIGQDPTPVDMVEDFKKMLD